MPRLFRSTLWTLGVLLSAVACRPAAADTAYSFTGGSAFGLVGRNVTLGFEFTTSAAISVTDLGFWDYLDDGLANSHDVGIWDVGGTLLTSTTVPSGVSATLDGGFRYVSIAPTTLAVGTYRIGALFYGGDLIDKRIVYATITMAPGLTYGGARAGFYDFTDPTFVSGGNAGQFGPNFKFGPLVVPEPVFYQMSALLGLGGLGLLRLRRRVRP